MRQFPWWMLALAFLNLWPAVACPLFLFGGLHPFGTSTSAWLNGLLYVLTNLLWVAPVLVFFLSLDLYRRGWEWQGACVATVGQLLTVAMGFWVFG